MQGEGLMGTNFYLHAPACSHCGHAEEPLHLGKSSAGWCFGLHIYPDKLLCDWQDMWSHIDALVENGNHEIKDEYGDTVDPALFFSIVWDRSRQEPPSLQWLKDNHAVPGPYGLARHKLDDHCIGHGEGPFDYIVGYFS